MQNIVMFVYWNVWGPIFSILDFFIPKRQDLLIFAAANGDRFGENSGHLFQFCLSETKLDVRWCTGNKELCKSLNERFPGKVISGRSLNGMYTFLRAKTVFITHGRWDVHYFILTRSKKVINLWHGMPIKLLGWECPATDHKKWDANIRQTDLIVVSSNFERDEFSKSFRKEQSSFLVTGMPRNDRITSPNPELLEKHPVLERKIVLYAPTWRRIGRNYGSATSMAESTSQQDIDFRKLSQFLNERDHILAIRGHYMTPTGDFLREQKKK